MSTNVVQHSTDSRDQRCPRCRVLLDMQVTTDGHGVYDVMVTCPRCRTQGASIRQVDPEHGIADALRDLMANQTTVLLPGEQVMDAQGYRTIQDRLNAVAKPNTEWMETPRSVRWDSPAADPVVDIQRAHEHLRRAAQLDLDDNKDWTPEGYQPSSNDRRGNSMGQVNKPKPGAPVHVQAQRSYPVASGHLWGGSARPMVRVMMSSSPSWQGPGATSAVVGYNDVEVSLPPRDWLVLPWYKLRDGYPYQDMRPVVLTDEGVQVAKGGVQAMVVVWRTGVVREHAGYDEHHEPLPGRDVVLPVLTGKQDESMSLWCTYCATVVDGLDEEGQ